MEHCKVVRRSLSYTQAEGVIIALRNIIADYINIVSGIQ
jgi:hypothetical protein